MIGEGWTHDTVRPCLHPKLSRRCLCCDQNWHKCSIVASFVKIFEVEGVIQNLIYRMSFVVVCTDLVFDHKNMATRYDDGVCPLTHARDCELQKKEAVAQIVGYLLEVGNLRLPRVALVLIDREHMMGDKLAKNGSR